MGTYAFHKIVLILYFSHKKKVLQKHGYPTYSRRPQNQLSMITLQKHGYPTYYYILYIITHTQRKEQKQTQGKVSKQRCSKLLGNNATFLCPTKNMGFSTYLFWYPKKKKKLQSFI